MTVPDTNARLGSGIPIGITYTIAFGIYGVFFPFISLILRSQGLSDAECGIAMSAAGLSAIVGPIFFAHMADRQVQFRRLMPALLVIGALMMGLLTVSHTVYSAFASIFLLHFFLIPALTLLDSFTVDFIMRRGNAGPRRSFLDYRIWGSIGFMLPSVALSLWLGADSISAEFLVLLSIGITLASACSAAFLPSNTPIKRDAAPPSKEAIGAALKPPLRRFFIASFFCGLGLGAYYTFFPRFLQELGCSVTEVGLIINLGVLFEVLLMPFGRRLIDRFGLERLLLVGCLSIPVRMLLTVLFPTIPVVLAVQILHAPLALGVFVGAPVFLQQRANASFRHSLQSIYSALMMGITRFLGPVIGAGIMVAFSGQPAITGLLWVLVATGALGLIAGLLLCGVSQHGGSDSQERSGQAL